MGRLAIEGHGTMGEGPVNYGGQVSCSGIVTGEGSGRSSGTIGDVVAQWRSGSVATTSDS